MIIAIAIAIAIAIVVLILVFACWSVGEEPYSKVAPFVARPQMSLADHLSCRAMAREYVKMCKERGHPAPPWCQHFLERV